MTLPYITIMVMICYAVHYLPSKWDLDPSEVAWACVVCISEWFVVFPVVLTGQWPKREVPALCGGPLEDNIYKFQKACFRWGPDSTEGSEHTIDFERYAMELQLYHQRLLVDVSDPGICTQENTFAIVSFLFQVSTHRNNRIKQLFENN